MDWQDNYVSVITLVLQNLCHWYGNTFFLFYKITLYCSGLSSPLDLSHETEAGFVFDNVDDKNSLASLTPIIFYDETAVCGLRGVFSTDDSIIAAEILYNLLLRGMNVSEAVEYPRYVLVDESMFKKMSNFSRKVEFEILSSKAVYY